MPLRESGRLQALRLLKDQVKCDERLELYKPDPWFELMEAYEPDVANESAMGRVINEDLRMSMYDLGWDKRCYGDFDRKRCSDDLYVEEEVGYLLARESSGLVVGQVSFDVEMFGLVENLTRWNAEKSIRGVSYFLLGQTEMRYLFEVMEYLGRRQLVVSAYQVKDGSCTFATLPGSRLKRCGSVKCGKFLEG